MWTRWIKQIKAHTRITRNVGKCYAIFIVLKETPHLCLWHSRFPGAMMPNMKTNTAFYYFVRILLLYVAMMLVCGCNVAQAQSTLLPTINTPILVSPATPVPTLDRALPARSLQAIPSPSPRPITLTPTSDPACGRGETTPLTRHKVNADVDFAHRRMVVNQQVHYVNRFEVSLPQIVFNVEPNRWAGAFQLHRVVTSQAQREDTRPGVGDEVELITALDETRLTVDLPVPLAPGCEIALQLHFALEVPPIGTDVTAYKGYFGYSARQMNLGHWLPTVAVRQDTEWVTHRRFLIGEQDVLETADWDVTVRFVGERVPVVAAPGIPLQLDASAWQYILSGARDFSLSLSADFVVTRQQAANDVLVELYSFADAPLADGHALDSAVRSVSLYAELFGEFAFDRLVIVQGDFPDGMEHSGLVFVSGDWFVRFDGNPAAFLTIITIHEVAHQWWYARVGSDAALTPWLDEALATYSELLYFEREYPALMSWWWDWRVARFAPAGFVDGTVYEFSTIREYINAVYLRGVWMLRDLREDLGDAAFFDWLRAYVLAADGQVATPDLFWSLLTPEQIALTQATRDQYLRNPQVTQR